MIVGDIECVVEHKKRPLHKLQAVASDQSLPSSVLLRGFFNLPAAFLPVIYYTIYQYKCTIHYVLSYGTLY